MTPMQERKEIILALAIKLLDQGTATVRQLAKFTSMVVASFQGVTQGALWYRRFNPVSHRGLHQG